MKVTIITATLNAEKYLGDCIQSVQEQEYNDIEYIVVDGQSTDNTLNVIRKNEEFISKWISETDRGMYDAINKGIKLATGDIIGIINSDDVFAHPRVLNNIVDCFTSSDTQSVYGDLMYVDPNNLDSIFRLWKGRVYKRSRFLYGWMPAHPTFYLRRELIQKYGLYENHFYTAADYEFMARYLYHYRISSTYLEQEVVRMRSGGMSNINFKSRLRANRRDYLAMKKNHIPLSFFVSILKPLSKIHQYKRALIKHAAHKMGNRRKPKVTLIKQPNAILSETSNAEAIS